MYDRVLGTQDKLLFFYKQKVTIMTFILRSWLTPAVDKLCPHSSVYEEVCDYFWVIVSVINVYVTKFINAVIENVIRLQFIMNPHRLLHNRFKVLLIISC